MEEPVTNRREKNVTIDERLNRIEHFTAGLDEQARKEREEARLLWRDTQRQLGDVTRKLDDLTLKLSDFVDETSDRFESIHRAQREFVQEVTNADLRLGKRIDDLVSAIGEFIAKVSKNS